VPDEHDADIGKKGALFKDLWLAEQHTKIVMNTLLKIVEWSLQKMKIIGAACLVGMMFLTCTDVVGRLMGHPIFGSVELVGFMATLAVAMAMPYTHQDKGHIGVEILWQAFSKRTRAIVDLCTGFLSLGLFSVVTWRMTLYAHTIQKSGEVSMNLELPEHVIIYIVAFCFVIFTLIILQNIIQAIKNLSE
jgi:TRAP-type C4-dicarboxylate transport system permease small subunit